MAEEVPSQTATSEAIVISHGGFAEFFERTFVPAGRKISFYTAEREYGPRTTTASVISGADLQTRDTYDSQSKDGLPNYVLVAHTPDEVHPLLASVNSLTESKIRFLGQGELPTKMYLCSQPDLCRPPAHGAYCTGLFKLVNATHIYVTGCRAGALAMFVQWLTGRPIAMTSPLGAPEGFEEVLAREFHYILSLAERGDAVRALGYFLRLPEATRGLLLINPNMRELIKQLGGQVHPDNPWFDPNGIPSWEKEAEPWQDYAAQVKREKDKDKPEETIAIIGNPDPPQWAEPTTWPEPPPEDTFPQTFQKCWDKDTWKRMFWNWFFGPAQAPGSDQELLLLYADDDKRKMITYYRPDDPNVGFQATERFALLDLRDICQGHGSTGRKPNLDSDLVDAFTTAVDDHIHVVDAHHHMLKLRTHAQAVLDGQPLNYRLVQSLLHTLHHQANEHGGGPLAYLTNDLLAEVEDLLADDLPLDGQTNFANSITDALDDAFLAEVAASILRTWTQTLECFTNIRTDIETTMDTKYMPAFRHALSNLNPKDIKTWPSSP